MGDEMTQQARPLLRGERWPSWLTGLLAGVAVGGLVLLGGAAFLVIGVAFLALAFVAARSVAFLSGTFIGVGGTWIALTVRAQLACDVFDAAPNQGCVGYGVTQFIVVSTVILVAGVLLGVVGWRRAARAQT